ncbi:hypothetical protein LDENG_00225990 [Lucifuga dentata]|nr:hypothetical protein LDENG_00225990 [Lucifuga dentata]
METFSRLTSMLLQALETREPTVDLLESFVDHWKSITNYYIETTDECCPVKQTEIPWHLRQMLDILVYEDKQQGVEEVGPCLEYLLQHKLLETLCTLGKAQYPPGMSQQVFLFFSKFLSEIQKPLLHLASVYRPVQKLIRLCAFPGSQTEKEEAQFLLAICSTIKQDPHALRYVLELPCSDQSQHRKQNYNHKTEAASSSSQSVSPTSALDPASSSDQSEVIASNNGQSDRSICSRGRPADGAGLLVSLLQLTSSQRASVSLKAYECLLLLSGLQAASSEFLSELCELLSGRLAERYFLLPVESLEPGDVQRWTHTSWSSQFSRSTTDHNTQLPGSEHVTSFFCWFDFLDHLMTEAPQVLAVKLAQCVRGSWMLAALQPQLLHTSEQEVLIATAMLCAAIRLVHSDALLDQLVHFLFGRHTQPKDAHTQTLTHVLLQRCDHISDQISMASLCLVEELLRKPHRDILDTLVLSYLETRSYLSPPPAALEDRQAESAKPGDDSE